MALRQVGGYLGYTGRDGKAVAKAALDPPADMPSIIHGPVHSTVTVRVVLPGKTILRHAP